MDDHISPTRRRWFQFRLRGLLVAVTLFAVFMGWLGWELKFVRERRGGYQVGSRQRRHVHYGVGVAGDDTKFIGTKSSKGSVLA